MAATNWMLTLDCPSFIIMPEFIEARKHSVPEVVKIAGLISKLNAGTAVVN